MQCTMKRISETACSCKSQLACCEKRFRCNCLVSGLAVLRLRAIQTSRTNLRAILQERLVLSQISDIIGPPHQRKRRDPMQEDSR